MSPTQPSATLLETLRDATAAAHAAIEARLPDPHEWTREDYVAFLRATLAVVGPVERVSEALLASWLGGRLERPPSERIRADLEALRADSAIDHVPPLPAITSPASAFGAAYVLEGSLLGGRVIANALESTLGLDQRCFQYLRPQPYRGWREFVRQLNLFGAANPAGWRSAASTAAGIFDAYERAFAREGMRVRSAP